MKRGFSAQEFHNPLPEIDAIGRLRIQQAGDGMPMEAHAGAFELLLLESGSKRIRVESEWLEMHGGDMLLLHPGETHGAPEQVQNRTSMTFLIFPDPNTCPVFLGMPVDERAALSRFLHQSAPRLCRISAQEHRRFISLFHACKPAPDMLNSAVRRAHLALLLDGYRRCAASAARELSPEIQRVVDKIRQERDRIPAVSELAACAYLSESRFKQKFRQQTGMPPMEYILRHKLQEARGMIEGGASVPRVASELGFSSDKHFTDAFRRYTGCTPAQYLNQKKGGEIV